MISLKVDSITLTSNLKSISFDFNCDCMFSISLFAFSIALFVFSIALFDWLVNQVNPFFLSFSELELVLEVKLSFAPKSSWSVYRIVSAMENTINLLFISICVINTVSLLILSTDVGKCCQFGPRSYRKSCLFELDWVQSLGFASLTSSLNLPILFK